MRNIRQLCAAVVLTCVLALSAFAGNMTTWVVEPPPPPPATASADTTAVDPVAEVAPNVLQSVLSLF